MSAATAAATGATTGAVKGAVKAADDSVANWLKGIVTGAGTWLRA